jgi:hypothetical protein
MPALDEDGHLTIEEREQQRAYVRPVNVSICVFGCNPPEATYEILIAFYREVIDISVGGVDGSDRHDRQRDQISVDNIEAATARTIGIGDPFFHRAGASVITPYGPYSRQIFNRRHTNLPMVMSRLENLFGTAARYPVSSNLMDVRNNSEGGEQI